ncbi:MAG: sigma-54-dependent Fis family transcriptional regulator [Deltaproteobacteria bacterium]|nr:sigma-54-dependent Fis family transcriptional regulator [Deltaproteobacteria bacterium]MBW1793209.1 sigma-54-dependent Fis family transcriptional regulator [Deltaproteobacteria bacterium]
MVSELNIMVVDDELIVRESLKGWLEKFGYGVDTAEDAREALEKLEREGYALLFVDIKMPGMDGVELLKRVKEDQPDVIVVMITAHGSIESAIEAMKAGASDYLMKPFDPEDLELLIEKLAQTKRLMDENRRLRESYEGSSRFQDLIGQSGAMQKLFQLIEDVAPGDTAVLIVGETGTGKELVAKAIHALSPRRYAPFVAVNCGAFTETLLESTLFGHEKGAFTGAHHLQKGRLEMANGGTLFLDEVGEISPKMQVDFLRVLEEKKFHRLGNPKPMTTDFRLISATHRDLEEAIQKRVFRQDFYYRINVITIVVPPLRERKEDIELLAHQFLGRYSQELNKNVAGISKEALDILTRYEWPGNVRELENVIERAVVIGKKRKINPADLPFQDARIPRRPIAGSLGEVEKDHISDMLTACDWNIARTASLLGINRTTLYKKIKKYGFKQPAS